MILAQIIDNLKTVDWLLFVFCFLLTVAIQLYSKSYEDKLIFDRGKEGCDLMFDSTRKLYDICLFVVVGLVAAYVFALPSVDTVVALVILAIVYITSIIMRVDFRVRIIPNKMLVMLWCCVAFYNLYTGGIKQLVIGVGTTIAVCIASYILLRVFHLLGAIGAGDVKMISVVAGLGGIIGLQYVALGMGVSFLAVVLPLLLLNKITPKTMVPFGPFIGCGILLACAAIV